MMKMLQKSLWCLPGLLALLTTPASATVSITSIHASVPSPQPIGTSITWTVTATDTSPNQLAFQYNVAAPGSSTFSVVKDYNLGTFSAGTWTSTFVWTPTGIEGAYTIKVAIKDFTTGQTTSKSGPYTINPLVTGSTPVVVATANPLVALFSAPSCAAGSSMRVHFQTGTTITSGNWVACHPPNTMTFEVAGMYPSTTYNIVAQTMTGGKITNSPARKFTTGPLPTNIPFPTSTVLVNGSGVDTALPVLLTNPIQFGAGPIYASVATDLAGNIIWYYYPSPPQSMVLTRPLTGGNMLTIQSGTAWNPLISDKQFLREIDLAGNIIRETNIGVITEQLAAMGATDMGPCTAISQPVVDSACVDDFHHDAIQSLPNGYTAVLVDIEKIYPAGTQGDSSGMPIDLIGDGIVVLDANFQVKWWWDAFQHAGGAPQLDINRPATLAETCVKGQSGCPPLSLLGSGINSKARDWLHCNSLYYWGKDTFGGAGKDFLLSSRNQDWLMKIDYNGGVQSGGLGTGNILWLMGVDGAFTFNNITQDLYPWFSGQHEAAIENNGSGPMTIFDNGNTRIASMHGNSRGMALTVDETAMTVTPVLSVDLGYNSIADGSAQLLANGNYYFYAGVVVVGLSGEDCFNLEILPTPGTITGTTVLNVQGADGYRGWQLPSLYVPPTS